MPLQALDHPVLELEGLKHAELLLGDRHPFKLGLPSGLREPSLDNPEGGRAYVDPDPLAVKTLGHRDRRATAAERVEDHIAWIAAGLDDPSQKALRLLRWVSEALLISGGQPAHIAVDPFACAEHRFLGVGLESP